MIVRFDKTKIYKSGFGILEDFYLAPYEACRAFGEWFEPKKVTLSLKRGKRRRLVPGQLRVREEYHRGGRSTEYLFEPNNREKFIAILRYQERVR